MTPQQLAALKADILANPDLNSHPNTSDGAFAIAAAYSLPAAPDFFIWRTSVAITEIMQNGFAWDRVDNLTVGKARIWEFMTAAGIINPSLSNVRAGFLAVFGVAADLATRQAIFNHCQEKATRGQKLFSTGNGTTATEQGVGPSLTALTSPITYQEVEQARNLP